MYASKNFRTKKALTEAVVTGEEVSVWQPGPHGGGSSPDIPARITGRRTVEMPWYPEPHRSYATVEVRDGQIIGVY